jgi:uncharacterized membrane protein YjgN (DUF898 family)
MEPEHNARPLPPESPPSSPTDPAPAASDGSPADPSSASPPEVPGSPTPGAETPPAAAALPPPEPPVLPAIPARHPVQFHGDAREFFRIWIVNTLLTLLSAGLFLAWAKVRKRRYLRGCTEIMGHRFDYRAQPSRILVGNLIVLVFFLGYTLFGVVYPPIRYGVMLVFVLMLPWIVVRSLSFNAYNTVYRGMRFRFNPSLGASAFVYLLEPVLLVITLGFYYPAWIRSIREYHVSHHRLGDAFFRIDVRNRDFYQAYLLGSLIIVGSAVLAGAVLAAIMGLTSEPGQVRAPGLLGMLPFFALYGVGLFVGKHFIFGRLFNQIWNGTRLDEHRFVANLKLDRWLGLQLTNLGAILISAGLLYPWTVIRTYRYTASCLQFEPAGPVEAIEQMGGRDGSGIGDSAGEFVGLDFGL